MSKSAPVAPGAHNPAAGGEREPDRASEGGRKLVRGKGGAFCEAPRAKIEGADGVKWERSSRVYFACQNLFWRAKCPAVGHGLPRD